MKKYFLQSFSLQHFFSECTIYNNQNYVLIDDYAGTGSCETGGIAYDSANDNPLISGSTLFYYYDSVVCPDSGFPIGF